jgi:hypothetical protein
MYGYYLFIKFNLRSLRTILPEKTFFHDFKSNPFSHTEKETKLCFIGDMEKFLESLKPHERKIIEMYYQEPEATFEYIARWFRIHYREKWDRRLFYRQNVHRCFRETKILATGFFKGKGYLR